MNIQEMHIEVNLGLQKINSNVNRVFYPEEIDWCLNKAIRWFINSKIKYEPDEDNGGLDFDTINSAALYGMIENNYKLEVMIDPLQKLAIAPLPNNLMYLINGGNAGTIRKCEGSTYQSAINLVNTSKFIHTLWLPTTPKTEYPFYEGATVSFNNVAIDLNLPPQLQSKEQGFEITNALLNQLSTLEKVTNCKVYWEKYLDFEFPNNLIFIGNNASLPLAYSFDGVTIVASNHDLFSSDPIVHQYKVPGLNISTNIKPVRLPTHSRQYQLMSSSFAKSRWESPIGRSNGRALSIFYDDSFIVNNVTIDYIRKPKIVSLSLGENCDINSDFHSNICDLAVEFITLSIGDPAFAAKSQFNTKNNN